MSAPNDDNDDDEVEDETMVFLYFKIKFWIRLKL